MVLVIPDYVFIANALYAKKTNFLSYDEIDKYYTILYQTLNKEYKYIDFNFSSDNYIKKGNHLFIQKEYNTKSIIQAFRYVKNLVLNVSVSHFITEKPKKEIIEKLNINEKKELS